MFSPLRLLPALLAAGATLSAATLETTLRPTDLDPAAYASELGGVTTPLAATAKESLPAWVIWTSQSQPGHSGVKFGETSVPGVRHLRLGFTVPVEAGSLLVRGGGSLSVLRPGAAYPGDPAPEEDWLPAQRLVAGEPSTAEAGPEDLALWTLPPGTKTRALRFAHTPAAADTSYAGQLGGIWLLPERCENLAPLASASASAQGQFCRPAE